MKMQVSGAQLASATLAIAQPRSTSMSVNCTPAELQPNQATTCIATVSDITQTNPSTPTGTVTWKTSGSGTFTSTTCTLSGTGFSSSCSVNYTPKSAGSETIIGAYGGSSSQPPATHAASLTILNAQNNSPTNPQTLSQGTVIMLGALAGGAGIIGTVAGVAVTLFFRRKPNQVGPLTQSPAA
jgi:hypothetical protein